jgi:hypothetical protein
MSKATTERHRCEVCGDPIRIDNRYGICTNGSKPACMEARRRRMRQGITAADLKNPLFAAGEVFGKWTALEPCAAQKQFVLCRCECGNTERRVLGEKLIRGLSRSCGCNAMAAMVRARFSAPYIAAGSIFGRLTVLRDVPRSTDRAPCRCACGREKEVNAIGLKGGTTKSCSCLAQERRSKLGGFSKHPLYPTWNGIIDRCTDPKHPSYANYGGRGITVCDRWRDPWAFAEDIEREIGPRPEGVSESGRVLYSLDRWPDNDGNYEPGNVRWSTMSEQVLNQRKVSRMTLEMQAITGNLDAVTQERDSLAARVAELESLLAACTCRAA